MFLKVLPTDNNSHGDLLPLFTKEWHGQFFFIISSQRWAFHPHCYSGKPAERQACEEKYWKHRCGDSLKVHSESYHILHSRNVGQDI